uniref:Pept_C1 domain-containing protein n=1 Tax=Bursaphelenchus xylophilus TaxID=6326 RepID=A0A1I7SBZ2_BURXY
MSSLFSLVAIFGCVSANVFTPYLKDHLELPSGAEKLSGDALVDYINSLKTTWTATKNNRFIGLSHEQQQTFLGVLDAPKEFENLTSTHLTVNSALPAEFDVRQKWPQCAKILNDIRDQSNCGSCWAVATVSAISDRICIKSNGKLQVPISAQDLMSCCRNCGYGCNGGYPEAAWNYYHSNGIVSGGAYNTKDTCRPYPFKPCAHHVKGTAYKDCPSNIERTPACTPTCVTNYLTYNSDKHRAETSVFVFRSEQSIQQEILENGPVEAAFTVFEDFLHYEGGVYEVSKEYIYIYMYFQSEIATAPEPALGSGSEPAARAGAGNFEVGSGSRAQSRSQASQRSET